MPTLGHVKHTRGSSEFEPVFIVLELLYQPWEHMLHILHMLHRLHMWHKLHMVHIDFNVVLYDQVASKRF